MCACEPGFVCTRCRPVGYFWRPEDLLILEVWENQDEITVDRREAELGRPDFASPYRDNT